MIEELREIAVGFAAGIKNNTLQNRRIGMAIILSFSLALLVSEWLKDIYIFGWMVWGEHSPFTGEEVRGFYPYCIGTVALLLLSFGRKCAACGMAVGNIAGLAAGHILGERHYAAMVAQITPDMDEGAVGALLCCAHTGVFIWFDTILALLAAGLAIDWWRRRQGRKAGG